MTTSDIEQALLAWAATLTSATGTPPVFILSGGSVRVSLHTNAGSDDLPGAHPMIIFGCASDGKVACNPGVDGSQLHLPTVKVCLSTPVLSGNFEDAGTLATHRALCGLMRSWFVLNNVLALSSALGTEANSYLGGEDDGRGAWYIEPAQEEKVSKSNGQPAWQFVIPVKLCLHERPLV